MTGKVKVEAVIQARMASTRLAGKILAKIGERTILEWVIERLRVIKTIERVVVATSTSTPDDNVEKFAKERGVDLFRGPEEDVLDRFHGAVGKFPAEVIVRATADNPLLDADFLGMMIRSHVEKNADYTGSAGSVPLGTAAEVLNASALDAAWRETSAKPHREHVTPYIYSNPGKFAINRVAPPEYLAGRGYRLTVDTPDDLKLMREIYKTLKSAGEPFDARHALRLLDARPELADINWDVKQKDWRGEL